MPSLQEYPRFCNPKNAPVGKVVAGGVIVEVSPSPADAKIKRTILALGDGSMLAISNGLVNSIALKNIGKSMLVVRSPGLYGTGLTASANCIVCVYPFDVEVGYSKKEFDLLAKIWNALEYKKGQDMDLSKLPDYKDAIAHDWAIKNSDVQRIEATEEKTAAAKGKTSAKAQL